MDKTINIRLSGHDKRFELEEDAYKQLAGYLERAGARLDEAERADVLGDLERSVGDRLTRMTGSDDRPITAADIDRVLDEIGPVDTDTDTEPTADATDGAQATDPTPPRRKLMRIRDKHSFSGVCYGLAVYADIDVDWMRTGWILGTLVTGGLLGLVYIALIFILPVAPGARQAHS